MASETVVLDSSNLAAIIADATGEPLEAPPKADAAQTDKAAAVKPKDDSVMKESSAKEAPADHEGLTEEEKRTYSNAMKKSIAWRHGKMREAQETASRERQGRLAAEERVRQIEAELTQLRVQPKAQAAPAQEAPKPSDFETTDAYIAARVKWDVDQALAKEREERRRTDEAAELERITATAAARVKRAAAVVPDWDEVVSTADVMIPSHIAAYMQESELLPELGYFFAKHPDELERISKLPIRTAADLVRVGVALREIESTLTPFAPADKPAKVEAHGASPAKPSTETDGNPSRPRVTVPVIQPLTARGVPEVEPTGNDINGRRAVTSFEKRTGASLTRRQRH